MAKLKFDRDQLAALLAKLPTDKDELTVVKDEGIYVMSFAEPRPASVPETEKSWQRTVVYAKGYNPHEDEDVWDKSRDAVGGDDFGEPFSTKGEMEQILADSVGDITIDVTAKSIRTAYLPKNASLKNFDVFKGAKTGKWRIMKDASTKGLFPQVFATKKLAQGFAESMKKYAATVPQEVR